MKREGAGVVLKCRRRRGLADETGHVVQGQTLVATDGETLVVMAPRSEEQELAAGAGLHALAAGLGKVGEAVLEEDDEGQAFVEGGTHDGLLTLGDAGRDEHGAAAGPVEPPSLPLGYLVVGEAA